MVRSTLIFGCLGAVFIGIYPPPLVRAQEPPPPCIVKIPVYDPFGERLSFRVTRLSPKNNPAQNLQLSRFGIRSSRFRS